MTITVSAPRINWLHAVLLVIALWLGYQWLASHRDLRTAKDTVSTLQARTKTEAAQAAMQISAINGELKAAKTPREIVRTVNHWLPAFPEPLTLSPEPIAPPCKPALSPEPTPLPSKPTPAPNIIIPPVDQQEFARYVAGCSSCQVRLTQASQAETNLSQERDAWKKAAKGGSFWHRVGRDAEYVGIGVAAGYVAAKR